jgi:hypothetical protein
MLKKNVICQVSERKYKVHTNYMAILSNRYHPTLTEEYKYKKILNGRNTLTTLLKKPVPSWAS